VLPVRDLVADLGFHVVAVGDPVGLERVDGHAGERVV
jgi:hypothetical protein